MIAVIPKSVLNRAGASDKTPELWHAERRQGITATEVKSLVKGYTTNEALALAKLIPGTTFVDNRYMAWGRNSEARIAEFVNDFYPGLALEHRVFKAESNPRFLASPDMIGVYDGELLLGEIKTSINDIALGTEKFGSAGYMWQMQWQMHVIGADECLYIWEQHNGDWVNRGGEFEEPSGTYGVQIQSVKRDEHMIEHLVETANNFLSELDKIREEVGL